MVVLSTVTFSVSTVETLSHAHSNKSGVLDAYLVSVKMDIDDDDEDIVIAMICVANEGTTPVGNLDVAIITNEGVKHTSQEGITSLGPGVERNWTFEFQQSVGEWTFSLKHANTISPK